MFTLNVDKNTNIVFLHHSQQPSFYRLYISNKIQLTQWHHWPKDCENKNYFDTLIKNSLFEYARGKAFQCGVSYKNEMIGYVGLTHINNQLSKAELGFFMSHEFQGRGLMAKVCQIFIDHAFTFLLLDKLEVSIPTDDISSRKLCESLDFQLEGLLQHADTLNGIVIAHARYGLTNPHIISS